MICVERPTGWWVTSSSDPDPYLAGPFETEELALTWVGKDPIST